MAILHAMTVPMYRFFFLPLILVGLLTPALAQVTSTITPDISLGTTVDPNGPVYTIRGGMILRRNQFHSFNRFDVGTGDTVKFTGPSTIKNILSRVTGGSPSMIDGTLQSDIPGANLYLLNPVGVVFGLNARLHVNGSFHVSTADMLRLGEDGTFHVSLVKPSALSVSAPSAFGFLRDAPSTIRIEGSRLAVPTGQTLSVVGGDIDLVGDRGNNAPATLAAPSGQMHLVSVASPGEVVFLPTAAAPDVAVENFARLGAITITDQALVDVSGEGGGTVRLRAARLDVDDSWIRADTEGELSGGFIDVQVDALTISSRGKVSVNTLNGSNSRGAEGVVSIVAADRVILAGRNSSIETITRGSGNAGQIVVRTR